MTEKVGLKIVDLIHSITQKDYVVSFHSDSQGMVRIDYTHEFDEFYEHSHVGHPQCERVVLEKGIIKDLSEFLEVINEG